MLEVLKAVVGPWSLIYWKSNSKELWLGRDRMGKVRHKTTNVIVDEGRRSLIFQLNKIHHQFLLSSTVSFEYGKAAFPTIELPPAIYRIQFTPSLPEVSLQTVHRWSQNSCIRTLYIDDRERAIDCVMSHLKQAIQVEISINFLKCENRFVVTVVRRNGTIRQILCLCCSAVAWIHL